MDLLDLFVKVGYDDSDVESGIAGTSKKGKGFASTLSKGFGTVATAVGVVATGIAALATAGVKYNATMEQYQVSFATMLGSAEAGVALTEKLKEKAASTPFEMTDLANVTQLLLNYGVTSDEVIDKMGMLGDISQGNADKLNSVALAYGQMSSLGKVTLQDVKQMIGAGFNPLQEISERTGESMESLYDRISDGTLAVDEITESMQYATSEGGKYFNAMENQSKTFNGLMSTLKDNAMSALGSITSGLSDIATQNVLPTLIGYVDELSAAFEEGGFEGLFDAFGSVLGDIVTQVSAAAPDVIDGAIKLLSSFVNSIINNLPTIIPAAIQVVMSLVNGILENLPILLQAAIDILIALATGIGEQLPTLIPTIVETLLFMVQTLIDNIPLLVDAAIQLVVGLAQGIIDALPLLAERIPELILSIVDAIVANLPTILESAVDIILALVQGLVGAIPDLVAAIPEIMMAIVQAFGDLAPDIWQAGADIVSGLWEGIKSMGTWLCDQVKDFASGVVDTFKGALGIASPSKVLADQVGKFMALGIGKGITDNIGAIKNAVSSTVDAVSGMDINASARVTGSAVSAGASGVSAGTTLGAMTFNFYDKVKTPYQTGRVINDTIQEALYGYGS